VVDSHKSDVFVQNVDKFNPECHLTGNNDPGQTLLLKLNCIAEAWYHSVIFESEFSANQGIGNKTFIISCVSPNTSISFITR